jgi:hypothetical protein
MTVHLISVGDGLVETVKRPTSFPPDLGPAVLRAAPHTALSRHTGDNDKAAADALLTRWLQTQIGPGGQLRRLVDEAHPQLWSAAVSAELSTFDRAARSRVLSPADQAILLATDTVRGLTAALWNAVALVGADLTRVRYASRPRDLAVQAARGAALVVRVPRLDARSEADLGQAMGDLGALGRALLPPVSTTGEDFRFYLSGGFKAAIPYLIGLAEGMRSLPQITGSVEAYVLHEHTVGEAIRLPLRRINPDWVRRELRGFDSNGTRTTRPDGNLLEGYAYDGHGNPPRRWELTAFGHGLRELFGLAPAELRG